ncbi:hypothetical protein CONLIGDRAFT_225194 [Coniochaeta ligniaria NRRL 30616]|uniref:Uncharacterized protein n=1 Tax=Coniochaeta ligniaria NRRL 30616 TaxID=1408157 RepID=A0A1J7I4L9_9PEZI|nr:hypothetical protein CONLIGDRAFT_225194 [Coniochaeta ligniaria NRRL 30616]
MGVSMDSDDVQCSGSGDHLGGEMSFVVTTLRSRSVSHLISLRQGTWQPQPHKTNGAAEEDSDDDLTVVDVDDLPARVKAKFTASPWTAKTPDQQIVGVRTVGVKKEPQASPQVIDLDEVSAPPPAAVKHEPQDRDGSLFGDDDMADVNAGPGAVAPAAVAAQGDDESMFVNEELFEPVADNLFRIHFKDTGLCA